MFLDRPEGNDVNANGFPDSLAPVFGRQGLCGAKSRCLLLPLAILSGARWRGRAGAASNGSRKKISCTLGSLSVGGLFSTY